MKNKFLSCLLAVVMITGLFVLPVSAATTDITVDLSAPTSVSDSTVTYSDGMINLPSGGTWAEYKVNATEAGSYHIKIKRASTNRTEFYVNGEHITWRAGRQDDAANSTYTFLNEVQLVTGENTVKVVAQAGKVGSISSLALVKLEPNRHLLQIRGIAPKAASTGLTAAPDPQVYALIEATEDNAPWVTYEMTVAKSGYYYPAIAQAGPALGITIGNQTYDMSNASANGESYANGGIITSWKCYNEPVYIEAGTHDITFKTITKHNANEVENWYMALRGFALYEACDGNNTFYINNVSVPANGSAEYHVSAEKTTSYLVSYEGASTQNIQIEANGKIISRKTGGNTVSSEAGNHARELHSEITLNKGLNTVKINTTDGSAATAAKVTFTKLDDVQYTTTVYDHNQAVSHISYEVTPDFPQGNLRYSKKPAGTSATITAYVPVSGWYYTEAALGGAVQFKINVNGTDLTWVTQQSMRYKGNCSNDYTTKGFPFLRANKSLYLEAGNQEVTVIVPDGGDQGDAYVGAVKFVAIDVIDGSNTFSVENITIPEGNAREYRVNTKETTSYLVSYEGASTQNIQIEANGKIISRKTGGNTVSSEAGNHARELHSEITLNEGFNTVKINTTDGSAATAAKVTFTKLDNVQYTTTVYDHNQAVSHISYEVTPEFPQGNLRYSKKPAGTSATITAYVPVSGWYYPEAALGGAVQFELSVNGTPLNWILLQTMRYKGNCSDDYGAKGFPYLRASKVYLEAGNQSVTLTVPEGGDQGDAYVGAVKFVAAGEPALEVTSATVNAGTVTVNYTAPTGTNFDIIVANFVIENGEKRLVNIAAPVSITGAGKAGSEAITVGTEGDVYEVFVWNSLAGMNPLLEKVTAE